MARKKNTRTEPSSTASAPGDTGLVLAAVNAVSLALKTTAASREREERLDMARRAAKVGIHDYDIKTGIIKWDSIVRDIWGVPDDLEPIIYEIFLAGVHPEDRPATENAIAEALAGKDGGSFKVEYRVINRKDRSHRWVEATGKTIFENGEAVRIVGTAQDITDRKEAEKTSKLLSNIVACSDDAIVSKNLDSTITSWNKGAENLFEYTEEEAIGKSITIIIPPERMQEEREILARLKRGETIDYFETVRVTKSGKRRDISVTISPLKDERGNIIGASKVARDITQQKKTAESLKAALEELKQADRKKNEFLAILGHELRNPLGALRGSIEILERGIGEPEELLDIMQSSVGTMAKLLDDLLDLTRVSQSRIRLDCRHMDLQKILARAVSVATQQYEGKKHALQTDIAGDLRVWGDETRLEQIFTNLIINACKYTPDGGKIIVSATRENGDIIVRVLDEGVGIEQDSLEKIFEPFYQVAPEGKAASGLGIGLALAKNLVHLHGGAIRAASAGKNQGTLFEVRLPAKEGEAAPEDQAPAKTAAINIPQGLKVVIVEDNYDVLMTSHMLLEQMGCEVYAADNAARGLKIIQDTNPDAALIDIGLPDMNGYEIAEKLRAGGFKKMLVAISGYSHQEARQKSKTAGFDHHLPKPARIDDIARILAPLRA